MDMNENKMEILRVENFSIIYKNQEKFSVNRFKNNKSSLSENKKEGIEKIKNISFKIFKGDKIGIAGSSGGGKSLTITGILGLLSEEFWEIKGEALFLGKWNLNELDKKERRKFIRENISYIPQDSANALNPYMGVLDQITMEIEVSQGLEKLQARKRAVEWLKNMGVVGDEEKLNQLPKKFSGGMRQRAVFVMAMVKNPKILIADEPSSALDVVNQLNTVEILETLGENQDLTIIYISHSPGMIKRLCNKVAIVDNGKIVEFSEAKEFFENPKSKEGKLLLEASKALANQGEIYE